MDLESARVAAREVAKRFGNFECERCAREIAKKLGKSFECSFKRLSTSDQSDVIGLAAEGFQISLSGVHVGTRIGDRVFDNLHPEGVPLAEWLEQFTTATDAPLVHESRPIQDFFGKVFLGKRFTRWLFKD